MKRLILVMPLAACASAPDLGEPPLPVEPPPRWAAEDGATEYAVRDAWWREFGDAGLDAIVNEALARNPRLEEAEARVRTALALAKAAGADLYPWAGAGAAGGRSAQYLGISDALPSQPGVPSIPPTFRSNSFGASLDLTWEVDLWGRIRSGQAAALADVESARALHAGARLSLTAQTTKTWFAAIEAGRQVDVSKRNLASAEALRERIDERFQRGFRTALDLELAQSEVSSARLAVARRGRVRDAALRQLEILAGRYPSSSAATSETLPGLPAAVPAGVPADVLARRPDLAAAERRVAAASTRIHEARASLYPRVSLTASGGLASNEIGDLLDGDFGVWSLIGNLTAPLFQGGRLRANVARTEAGADEAIAAFAGAVLRAFFEVERALAAERLLAEQAAAAEALLRDARTSLRLSEERFLEGLADILVVLEARRRFFAAESELLRARGELLANRVDLYVALGGGFEREKIRNSGEDQ